jgi:hypothetical protein
VKACRRAGFMGGGSGMAIGPLVGSLLGPGQETGPQQARPVRTSAR